jgi:hypothetical protein
VCCMDTELLYIKPICILLCLLPALALWLEDGADMFLWNISSSLNYKVLNIEDNALHKCRDNLKSNQDYWFQFNETTLNDRLP